MNTRADGPRPGRHQAASAERQDSRRGQPRPSKASAWPSWSRVLSELEESLADPRAPRLRASAIFWPRRRRQGLPLYRVCWAPGTLVLHCRRRSTSFPPGRADSARPRVGRRRRVCPAHAVGQRQRPRPARPSSCRSCTRSRSINRGLESCKEFGLTAADLVPLPRIAGREPLPRFFLENGDGKQLLPHLRDLAAEVRQLGEKASRSPASRAWAKWTAKSCGTPRSTRPSGRCSACNWTTPSRPTRCSASLMGEKVEPRREFIQKHALEVKEIDYHGA